MMLWAIKLLLNQADIFALKDSIYLLKLLVEEWKKEIYAIMLMKVYIIALTVILWMEFHLRNKMINFIQLLIKMDNRKNSIWKILLMAKYLEWHVMVEMLLLIKSFYQILLLLETGFVSKIWELILMVVNQLLMEWKVLNLFKS